MKAIAERLRQFALSYPETGESHPWGEIAIKVKDKTFLFMRADDAHLSFSVKLPHSRELALDRDFVEPDRLRPRLQGVGQREVRGESNGTEQAAG